MTIEEFMEKRVTHIESGLIHYFDGDVAFPDPRKPWEEHVFLLDCPCHPTPVTEKFEGRNTVVRCIRHHFLPKVAEYQQQRRIGLELLERENEYLIQDAANLIRPLAMKGDFAPETIELLHEQIECVYDPEDLKDTQ